MAIKQPTSTITSASSSIAGRLGVGYICHHPTNPFVVVSDESGRAIARTMGLTIDQAVDFADQIITSFNRQRTWARTRRSLRLLRHCASFAIAGTAVYALIVAVCLFL